MGSDCAVRLDGLPFDRGMEIAKAAEVEVRRIEARYSRFREDSELSRLNRVARVAGSTGIDAETEALILFSKTCWEVSGGAFDITAGAYHRAWSRGAAAAPSAQHLAALGRSVGFTRLALAPGRLTFLADDMELDLGGVGKEYAADRACEVCRELGGRHGFVNLAGDIRVIGPQPDGAGWRFGVKRPETGDGEIDQVELGEGAIATSGDYERHLEIGGQSYSHFIDPATGWPSSGLASVTVIASNCMAAGGLATSAMIMGRAGVDWLIGRGVSFLAVDHGRGSWSTPPFRRA